MSANDLVKYLTVQFVERIDNPRSKNLTIDYHNPNHDSFSTRWFGLIPLSLKIMARRFQKND
ncbi:hypothetical protein BHF71_08275 [Vulcanibacillus modesticaldus]|uniref:Uncharacterized protein n=1 Tax=Vulcanibacillus modesticaldus TaxID=337097 RepID=A0A1D2YV76_9BACI|nr:YqzE family protein [Vulcanibacillus modesticaldus]OEF99609.1 hypothetical protein BHF71_08275 [Vulcanibacillus modesticaldus]